MAVVPLNTHQAFGVTNIYHEIFHTHCLTFDVAGHIDGTSLPNGDNDLQWNKRNGLVKLWIYGTLAPQLFRSSFESGGTSRDIWVRIENKFRNNKEARSIQLGNELRTLEISDLSIEDYSQKLKSLSDRLANVDAPVADRTLVTYLRNGLNERFNNIINVIQHREPLPTFATEKSMLQMEETRLKGSNKAVAQHTDHSSFSMSLSVENATHNSTSSQQQRSHDTRGNMHNNENRFRGHNNQRSNFSNWN